MKRFNIIIFLCLICSVYQLFSYGLGIYGGYHIGAGSFDQEFRHWTRINLNEPKSSSTETWQRAPVVTGFSVGFVYDSRVLEDKLVNYRLNVGFNYSKHTELFTLSSLYFLNPRYRSGLENYYDVSRYDCVNYGVEIDNTIGFGFVRTKTLRLWAGPKLKITSHYSLNDNLEGYKEGIGGAPVVGINIHLGEAVSLSADMGYNLMYVFGGNQLTNDEPKKTLKFSGAESHFFFNISCLFPLGEAFSKTPKKGGFFDEGEGK